MWEMQQYKKNIPLFKIFKKLKKFEKFPLEKKEIRTKSRNIDKNDSLL